MNARAAVHLKQSAPPELTAHARYLMEIVDKTGERPGTIARKLGLPQSTLTRHMPDRDGRPKPRTPRSMHAEILAGLERFSGIPAPSAERPTGGPARPARLRGSDLTVYSAVANDNANISGAVAALVAGRKNAEQWLVRTRALEGFGYLPDDLVIVDRDRSPADGDVVCVQHSPTGLEQRDVETLIRVYRDTGGIRFAIGASLDQRFMQPIMLDNRHGVVMGVVTHTLRIIQGLRRT